MQLHIACMLWPIFTICIFSQSKPSQRYCEFWMQDTWAVQLVWKAHLCSARKSFQETGVKQFPDRETLAAWLLVDVETSCQMAPEGHWTVHLVAHPGSTRKDESRWNTLRGTVELNVFDIDHCWQFCTHNIWSIHVYTSLKHVSCLPLSQRPSFVLAVSIFLYIVLAVPSRLPPTTQPPHLHTPPHTITHPLAVSGHFNVGPVSSSFTRRYEEREGGGREGEREGGTELERVVVTSQCWEGSS